MKKRFGFIKCLSSILILCNFMACEIGLGEAVDSQAPKMDITTPDDNAIIRGAFRISGTWEDDGTIVSAEVELYRPDSYGKRQKYNGVVQGTDKSGKWYVIVDPSDNNKRLVDGTYVANITVYDGGGHSVSKSVQFCIDNTPPVVVLQKPSSKEDTPESEIDSYGQIFNIQGQAADDNNVSKIKVSFYSSPIFSEDSFLCSVEKDNVPPTIDLDIATFGEDNYTKIYGSSEKSGTNKNIYCQVEAYDGAKKYSLSTGKVEEEEGNVTNFYYRYNDIATAVLSEKGIKITDLYQINSGNYELKADRSAASVDMVNSVKALLEGKAVTSGRFSLNPENNPSFTISGHNTFAKNSQVDVFEDLTHNISNGSNIVMEVAVGLDAWPLNEDIWFYLVPCDNFGVPLDSNEKLYIDATRTPSGTSYKFVTSVSTALPVYSASPYGKTDDQKAAIKTDKLLEVGQNYLIRFEGTDQKDNPIFANGNHNSDYGIHLSSSGAAPVFSNVLPKESSIYVNKGGSVTVSGDVSTEEGLPELTISCGGIDYPVTVTAKEKNLYTFTKTISKEAFSQTESAQYEIKIVAKTDSSSSVQKTVVYDVDGPVISLDSIKPLASKYADGDESGTALPDSYLNGEFIVRTSIDEAFDVIDTNTNKPLIQIVNSAGEIVWTDYLLEGNKIRRETTINTLDENNPIPDDNVKIRITAWDRAGNKTVYEEDYIIDQTTDNPVVLPYSADSLTFKIDTEAKLDETGVEGNEFYGKNVFVSGSQMMLRLLDDDGIKNVKIYYSTTNKKSVIPFETKNYASNMDISYTSGIPERAGKYYCWVDVTDVKDNITTKGPFLVKVTTAAPIITLTRSAEYKPVIANGYVTNTIEVESSEAPFTLWAKTADEEDFTNITNTPEVTYIEATQVFEIKVAPSATTTYTYKVRDKNTKDSNEKSIEIKVDNTAPTLSITTPESDETFKGTTSITTTQKFDGACTDTESKIKNIWYKIMPGNTATAPAVPSNNILLDDSWTADSWTKVTSVGLTDWNFYQSVQSGNTDSDGKVGEGERKIYLYAVDNAGNVSSVAERKFVVDLNPPTLSTPVITEAAESCVKIGNTYYVSDSLTGSITAGDTNGIASLQYKIGDAEAKDLTTSGTYSGTWTIPAAELTANADSNVAFIVKDVVGKVTEQKITVHKDTVAPVVSFTTPTQDELITKASGVVVKGSIEDTGCGTARIEYTNTYDAAKTDVENGWTAIAYTDGASNWSKTLDSFTSEGVQNVYIRATDKLGKVSTVQQLSFNYDKALPVLTVDAVGSFINNGTLTLSGSAKDSNGLKKVTIAWNDISRDLDVSADSRDTVKNWSLPLEVGTGKDLVDGTYTFTITALDAADRESVSQTVTVTVDNTKPDAPTVTNPVEAVSGMPANYVSGSTFAFTGRAEDKVEAGKPKSGIAKLYYAFTDSSAVPAAGVWKTQSAADGTWNINMNLGTNDADHTSTNNTDTTLYEGHYWLHVKSEDAAGNVSDSIAREFYVDQKDPVSTITGLTAGSINYFKDTQDFIVTGVDSYGIESITATVDKGTCTVKTGTNPVTYTLSDSTANQEITVTVTVIDKAQRKVEKTFTAYKDTQKPTVTVTSPAAGESVNTNTKYISGTASDDGCGVDKVYYAFTTTSAVPAFKDGAGNITTDWTAATLTGNSWASNVTLSREGSKFIHVTAVDKLGNPNADVNTVEFYYDLAKPEIRVDSVTSPTNSNITLAGKVWDSNKTSKVVIKEGSTEVKSIDIGVTSDSEPDVNNWNCTLELGAAAGKVNDGSHSYTIIVYDIANKEASKTIDILVDTKAPASTVTTVPSATQTENNSFDFVGTADDTNGSLDVSGVSTVKVAFINAPESVTQAEINTAASASTAYTAEYTASTKTWSYTAHPADITAFSTEGVKYICVKATDNASNSAADWSYKEFNYDKAKPTVTVDTYSPSASTNFSLSGTMTDYKFADSDYFTIVQRKNDDSTTDITLTENITVDTSAGTWSVAGLPRKDASTAMTAADSDADWTGKYKYIITVKDWTGKENDASNTESPVVTIDKVSPTTNTITSPAADVSGSSSLVGTTYVFKGKAKDNTNGTGVAKIHYKFDSEASWTEMVAGNDVEWSITKDLGTGPVPSENPVAGTLYEGQHTLDIMAEDAAGNKSSAVTRTFYVDQATPSLTETGIGATTKNAKAGDTVTLSGKAWDSSGSATITIKEGGNTLHTIPVTAQTDSAAAEWSQDLTLADGEHTITVTIADAAGRTIEALTRTIKKDTKAPDATLTVQSPTATLGTQKWYNSPSIALTLTDVTDPAASAENTYNSGIATVEYTTDYPVDSTATWYSFIQSAGTTTWTATPYISTQGVKTITVKVKDAVGNETTTSSTVYVDTKKPAAPIAYTVDGTESFDGTKLSNKTVPVVVVMTVSDDATGGTGTDSGIASISYNNLSNSTVTAAQAGGSWILTINKNDITTGTANIYITDNVGNQTVWSPFSFDVDTTAPVTAITAPSAATVNGTQTISGTVKENNPKSVKLYYRTNAPTAAATGNTITATTGWTLLKGITTETAPSSPDTKIAYGQLAAEVTDWSFTGIDFNSLSKASTGDTTNGYKHNIWWMVQAEDTHGNVSAISTTTSGGVTTNYWKNYDVDMDGDRPVLTLSTLDFSGSTVWLKNQTKLIGTISDDDGISKLEVGLEVDGNITWKNAVVSGVSWSFDITSFFTGTDDEKEQAANGSKVLHFRVTDSAGTVFASGAAGSDVKGAGTLASPGVLYLKDSGTNEKGKLKTDDKQKTADSTILNLTVDTLPPSVEITGAKLATDSDYSSSISSIKLGGDKKSFVVKTKVTDGVGIKTGGVTGTATFKYDSTNSISVTGTTEKDLADSTIYIITFTLTNAQVTTLKTNSFDNNVEIRITAEDQAGNKTTQSPSITADYKAPVINVLSPSSEQYSSGNVSAYGTLNESSTIYYALSTSDTVAPGDDSTHLGTVVTSWAGINPDTGAAASTTTISIKPYYQQIEDAGLSWNLYFDGTDGIGTHYKTLKQFIIDSGITTDAAITDPSTPFETIVKAYLWLKAIDGAGNETVYKHLILIDPQGERPSVTMSYPSTNGETLGGSINVYGTATPKLSNSMKHVWMQLVSNYHKALTYDTNKTFTLTGRTYGNTGSTEGSPFSITKDDLDYLAAAGYNVYNMKTFVSTAASTKWTVGASVASGYYASDYGILIDTQGSTGWSQKINESGEFNNSSAPVSVGIKVLAEDDHKHFSMAITKYVSVDAGNPVISNVYLRQYANNAAGTGDVTATKEYKDNMYVKGIWWITGTASDDDNIKTLKVTDENGTTLETIVSGGTSKNKDFKYKVTPASGIGKKSIKILATDGADHDTSKTITVYFDNTPPTLAATNDSDYAINPSVANSNGFYSFGSKVTEPSEGSTSQSGLDYVAFYFMRPSTKKIYDIMRPQSGSNETTVPNTVVALGSSSDTSTTDNTVVYSQGLYWQKYRISSKTSNSVTISSANVNAHRGGLVSIGGSIYLISGVNNPASPTVISINENIDTTQTYTYAYFALANVVNNTVTETAYGDKGSSGYGLGYYESPANDDGDLIVEKITTQGIWSAEINSKNIPDGKIELHYVAFDKAGNYSIGIAGRSDSTWTDPVSGGTDTVSVYAKPSSTFKVSSYGNEAFVSNNCPRLAGVTIKTDYNRDGTYSDDEIITEFNAASMSSSSITTAASGTSKAIYDPDEKNTLNRLNPLSTTMEIGTSTNAVAVLKGKTEIWPEIVGGNGSIYYSYEDSKGTNGLKGANSTAIITSGSSDYTINDIDENQQITLQLGDLLKAGEYPSTAPDKLELTFHDSTDGITSASDAFASGQSAKLTMYVGIQAKATSVPSAKIDTFYWTDKAHNSLYGNSTENGHIELESDLPSSFTTGGTGVNDRDPKVSGKVIVTGTAHDDVGINKLYFSIPAMENQFGGAANANITDKIYINDADGTIKNASGTGITTYYCLASPNASGILTGLDKFSANGFKLEITKNTNGISGNDVEWSLSWDTSTISNVAASDVVIQVLAVNAGIPVCEGKKATDAGYVEATHTERSIDGETYYKAPTYTNAKNNVPSSSQTTKVNPTSRYRVDVVPYVTAVGTKFASKDKNIKGSYSRTAKGHYIVASDEKDITLSGFNLTGGKVVFTGTNAEDTLSSGKFKIPAAARTGAFKVQVSGVDSLNNLNNNNAAGDSEKTILDTSSYSDMTNYAYNRCPNNISNNLLTDDLYFDIWELNNRAATSRGALKDPVMHINQASEDKEIGFGFVNAADGVSFPASGNSYVWFQKNRKDYKGTNFVYDNNGVAHNISIGLDAQASSGIAGRMNYNNSNWYSKNSYGSDVGNGGEGIIKQWDLRYNVALETIGIPKGIVVKGTSLSANIIDTDRFVTPAMAVSTHGNDKVPTVYIMYYDTDHDQIRFRYGEIDNTNNNKSRQKGDKRTGTVNSDYHDLDTFDYYQYGLLNDSKAEVNSDNTTTITSDTRENNDTWSYHHMFEASKDYYALVAGQYYKQNNNDKAAFDTGNKGSAYYGLDVVPGTAIGGDKVVMIWYDEDAQKLMYMYRENLTAVGDNTDATSTGVTNKWSAPVALVQDILLQDCVIKVDSKGGIHIAYYDQTNADLIYGYMSAYNKATDFKTCVVDAYSQVGNRISIDTAVHATNGKVVPYISYFSDGMSSLPKMAYLPNGVAAKADVVDGADAGTTLFTGNWEVTLIPTSSVLQAYNVGIGVWKDDDGKAIEQTAKTDVAYSTTDYNQKCYANGTSELVVGYSTKKSGVGYMETAMRR